MGALGFGGFPRICNYKMEGEAPGSFSQRSPQCYGHGGNFQQNPSGRNLLNISVQTGEEFSMEFLQDRAVAKGAPVRPVHVDNDNANKVAPYNAHHQFQQGYEDFRGILGLRRLDSDCNTDASKHVRSNSKEYIDTMAKIPSINGNKVNDNSLEENYNPHGSGHMDSSNLSKLKFICSFGGKILPRPGDGKLRYVGGEKRIVSIKTRLTLRELMQKTLSICNQPHTIKYQLPGEDLDALISVSSDEDLQNMMEEYYGLEKADGSQRIHIFLIPLNESESSSIDTRGLQSSSEYQYVVAVNNIIDPKPRNSSSGNSMSPSYHRDSSFLQPQSDKIDTGMPSHYFFNSQITSKPTIHSPPFSPKPGLQKENNLSQKQSTELENYYVAEPGYFVPKPHSNLKGEVEIPTSSRGGVQFQNQQYIREVPPSFIRNEDRGFHSEMIQRQQDDSLNWVSGSNDSFDPLQGIPHAYSDSLLQEQSIKVVSAEKCTSNFNFTTSQFPQNPCQSNMQGGMSPSRQNMDFGHPSNLPYNLQRSTSKISQFSPNVSGFPHHLESNQKNEATFEFHCYHDEGPQCGEMIDQPESRSREMHVLTMMDEKKPFPSDDGDMVAYSPSISWPKGSLEVELPTSSVENKARDSNAVESSKDPIYSSPTSPVSYLPHGIMSQNLKKGNEHGVASTDLESLSWPLFQNPEKKEALRREASLLDSVSNVQEHITLETELTVEDVTGSVPFGIPETPPIIPHVFHDPIEDGFEICDTSSPKVTDAEGNTSGCEDADERNMDSSISDAASAEIEASIYGLQTIKNADLEELRELGSGTFGTVYHGKWRGSDVAIKRIKKSCFAGRSSEQERLTKDFWREAQILSKLHHPNVVAFYGVVPDGTGGTLATVTEFMVNGSLRHVLLRKDRALDRRKRLIIASDAAFGMEYLHSKNIVHFDLKCDNLLVNLRDSQRPICKVADFGLSRIKRNTLVSGGVRGTLPWMAPELLDGGSNRVSEKVDVFSFGIAMWEILTGEEPYSNLHCGAIIGGILNNTLRPSIPDSCDPKWRKLMEQCWSHDPSARPSFTEITNRLRSMSTTLQPKGHTNR